MESFKEVKLIREGKLPKRSWKDFMNEHKKREKNKNIPTKKIANIIKKYCI